VQREVARFRDGHRRRVDAALDEHQPLREPRDQPVVRRERAGRRHLGVNDGREHQAGDRVVGSTGRRNRAGQAGEPLGCLHRHRAPEAVGRQRAGRRDRVQARKPLHSGLASTPQHAEALARESQSGLCGEVPGAVPQRVDVVGAPLERG
jgi:hypothetical protein